MSMGKPSPCSYDPVSAYYTIRKRKSQPTVFGKQSAAVIQMRKTAAFFIAAAAGLFAHGSAVAACDAPPAR